MVRISNTITKKEKVSNIEIIKQLIRDGRKSYVDIAEELDVTETAIRKRVRRMEKEGIIINYSIEIDPRKLGYGIKALIGIDTTPQKYTAVTQKLKSTKEVLKLYSSTGDHMIMMECWFRDDEKLHEFVEQLETINGIVDICPTIITDTIK